MNAFFISQFSYCPLVWVCHTRASNSKINRLHKLPLFRWGQGCTQALLANIYPQKQLSFERLLEKDDSVYIHTVKLSDYCNWSKVYKIKNDLFPFIVKKHFEQKKEQHYILRNNSQFTISPLRTMHHGSESISFIGSKIWNYLTR